MTQFSRGPSHDGEFEFWRNHSQISVQPVAAPSILGLFGFAAATFIVAANLAGWYGDTTTPTFLFPFAAFAGGLAQFLAGRWAYRVRDGLATAMQSPSVTGSSRWPRSPGPARWPRWHRTSAWRWY